VRTVASLISGIPGHKIRIVSPDIGGGFGNKVGVYPGYICSIVASIVLGVPVKWVEDRMENLQATAFARDYHMSGEIAATQEGRITALRVRVLADHGAFDALFSISQATRIQIRLIGRQAPRRCLLLRRTPPNVRSVALPGLPALWRHRGEGKRGELLRAGSLVVLRPRNPLLTTRRGRWAIPRRSWRQFPRVPISGLAAATRRQSPPCSRARSSSISVVVPDSIVFSPRGRSVTPAR